MNVEHMETMTDAAPSLDELKKAAGRMSNWRERAKAAEALGELGGQPAVDVLERLAKNDPVYRVQQAAYRALTALGVEAAAPERRKGEPIKGTGKILLRIKKSLPAGHDYAAFKEKLKNMRSDVYDTYEGDKDDEFDAWLERTWASLSGR